MNVHIVFYLCSVHWNHAVSDQGQAFWIHSCQSCSDTEPANFSSQEDFPLLCAMLRSDTVFVSHTIDPIQTRLCTAAAISPNPESLLKYFEGSLLLLFIQRLQAVCSHLTSMMHTTVLYRCMAVPFHFPQKQLHSPLHNSIIFTVQKHVPEASLVSSSSSTDNLSAGDVHSHLSPLRIRK